MRLATVELNAVTTAVRVDPDGLVKLPFSDVGALLQHEDWLSLAAGEGDHIDPSSVSFKTLIPHPNKIVCLGLNYATHIAEMGRPTPEFPTLFAKFDGCLIGADDAIILPTISDQVDWEAELGVVIGTPGRHIAEANALGHVAGYTVINDVTVRDWQHRTHEFLSGKTFEATTPVGPHLVTSDELPKGGAGLAISCEVDGVQMQSSNTDDLLFTVAETVAYISTIITLLPGDLIAMGTPGGVGAGRDPKVFLLPGQELVTRLEGVGELHNMCVPEGQSLR